MRVVGVDHLVLRVSDFARSKRFYAGVLGALGFALKYDLADHAGWSNGKTLFWIGQADATGRKRKFRLGDVGFHHYAFEMAKRADVDALYEVLQRQKVKVVDPPGEYYEGGYYAVYFLDPDGMKLEAMYYPPEPKRRRRKGS